MTTYTAEISVHAKVDDMPVRGNALASGDNALDKKTEDKILERLELDDVWAWASVEVRAEFRGLSASTYLGECSYDSEEDFRASGGYFDDMVAEAIKELNDKITDLQGVTVTR